LSSSFPLADTGKVKMGSSLLLTLAQLREFFNPFFEPPIGGYQGFHSLDHTAHRAVLCEMKLPPDTLEAIAPQTPGQIDRHIPRFVEHPPPGMEQQRGVGPSYDVRGDVVSE